MPEEAILSSYLKGKAIFNHPEGDVPGTCHEQRAGLERIFITENPQVWHKWASEDVVKNVDAALQYAQVRHS
jgi:hypothetical protein